VRSSDHIERRAPARSIGRRRRRIATRNGLLFVGPWIVGFLAFFLYPFVATIYYSFTNFNGLGAPSFVGLARLSGQALAVAFSYGALTLLALGLSYAGRGLGRRAGTAVVVAYAGFVAFMLAR